MGYVLGVDFGTSFTAAVAVSNGASRVVTLGKRAGAVPTATFLREDGTLIHGEDAYLVGAHDPDRLVRNLKRRLSDRAPVQVGDRSYPVTELVSAYLRWVVDAASISEGAAPDRLLFTHPANWRSVRLEQFRICLSDAGLSEVSFAPEPFAAAAFHSVSGDVSVGDLIGVYDLGGGTFDAAVLRRTPNGFELAGDPEGVEHLGGLDFDDILFHLVRTRVGEPWNAAERRGGPSYAVAVSNVRRECVAAKEALSVDSMVEVPVMLPGVSDVVRVTRNEFERLIGPSVADSIGAFRRTLRHADVGPSELAAVLLVGGSVALDAVRAAVRQVVGDLTPILDGDPKYAVARGAALLAAWGQPLAVRRPRVGPDVPLGAPSQAAPPATVIGATHSAASDSPMAQLPQVSPMPPPGPDTVAGRLAPPSGAPTPSGPLAAAAGAPTGHGAMPGSVASGSRSRAATGSDSGSGPTDGSGTGPEQPVGPVAGGALLENRERGRERERWCRQKGAAVRVRRSRRAGGLHAHRPQTVKATPPGGGGRAGGVGRRSGLRVQQRHRWHRGRRRHRDHHHRDHRFHRARRRRRRQ